MKKLIYGLWIVILLIGLLVIVSGCASTGTTWNEAANRAHTINGVVIQTAQDLLPVAQVCLAPNDYAAFSAAVGTAGLLHTLAGQSIMAGDEKGYEAAKPDLVLVLAKIAASVVTIQKAKE